MSYEQTHLLLMLKGPDAAEFVSKNPDNEEEVIYNFGNFVTTLEYKVLSVIQLLHL